MQGQAPYPYDNDCGGKASFEPLGKTKTAPITNAAPKACSGLNRSFKRRKANTKVKTISRELIKEARLAPIASIPFRIRKYGITQVNMVKITRPPNIVIGAVMPR